MFSNKYESLNSVHSLKSMLLSNSYKILVLICFPVQTTFLLRDTSPCTPLRSMAPPNVWLTSCCPSSSNTRLYISVDMTITYRYVHISHHEIQTTPPSHLFLTDIWQVYPTHQLLSYESYNLLQHLQVTKPGLNMNFFVIGAANFADRSNQHAKEVPSGSSKFFWAKEMDLGGFAYMEIMKQNATFTFIDGVGKNLYQKMLFPRMSSSYNWLKCRLLL